MNVISMTRGEMLNLQGGGNFGGMTGEAAGVAIPAGDLLEQLNEANFLAGFARKINSGLEIRALYETAARLLYDYLRYSLLIFRPAAGCGDMEPMAFAAVSKECCREELIDILRDFKGISLDDINSHESLGLDVPRPAGVLHSRVFLDLPEDAGNIAIFWGEEICRRTSGTFLNDVLESFVFALKNALEFKKLKELSMRDALTGLFNRRVFEEMLAIEGERRDPAPLAVVMIDLDDFKKINDTYGHQAGDMILSGFGDFLRKNCRGTELIARYGGEEFVILLPTQTESGAYAFVKRLLTRLGETEFITMGNRIKLTASMGVAHNRGKVPCEVRELLRRADLALYRAKNTGKNRACLANDRLAVTGGIGHHQKIRHHHVSMLAA